MGIINAKLRILDKVDNTADTDKVVKSARYPVGFISAPPESTVTWGNRDGDFVTDWHDATGGDIQIRDKDGSINFLIDGYFYQNEGNSLVLDNKNFTNYAAAKEHTHDYIPLSGSANLTGYLFPAEHNQVMLGNPSKAFSMICGTDYRLMNSDNTTSRMQLTVSSVGKFKNNQPMISFWFVPDDGGLKQGNLSIGNLTTSGINWSLPNKSGDLVTDTTITDWNKATTSGFYNSPSGATNAPVSNVAITGNVSALGNMIVQVVYPESNDDTELISYTRKGIKNNYSITWTKWIKDTTLLKTYIIKGHNGAENLFKKLIPSTTNSIIFTNTFIPSDATLIDVDEDGDGGVVAWLDTSDNTKMYVSTQHKGVKIEGNINSSYMFHGCNKLTSLNVSSFDTSKVTNMRYMFQNSKDLKTIYVSNKFNTDTVIDSTNMFTSCTSLVGGNGTTYDSTKIDKTYARIDTASTPGYFTAK